MRLQDPCICKAHLQAAGEVREPQTWPWEHRRLLGRLLQSLCYGCPGGLLRGEALSCHLPPGAWAGTAASVALSPVGIRLIRRVLLDRC